MTSSALPPDSRISTLQARLAGLKAEIVQLHKENAASPPRPRAAPDGAGARGDGQGRNSPQRRRYTPEWRQLTAAEWARSLNLEKPISRSLVAKLRGGKPVNPQVFHRIVIGIGQRCGSTMRSVPCA